jgi:hypothetical protein
VTSPDTDRRAQLRSARERAAHWVREGEAHQNEGDRLRREAEHPGQQQRRRNQLLVQAATCDSARGRALELAKAWAQVALALRAEGGEPW